MGNPDTPAVRTAARLAGCIDHTVLAPDHHTVADLARVARHLRLRLEVEGRAGLSAVPRPADVPPAAQRTRTGGTRRTSSGAARATVDERDRPLPRPAREEPARDERAAAAVEDLKEDFSRARASAGAASAEAAADAETYEEAAAPAPAPAVHVKGPGLFDQLSPDLEDGSSPEDALQRIADEVGACSRCPELAASRTKTVPGQGSPYARLVFIGEGPGADEDVQGLAFVGRAGQLLTKMIEGIGMTRDEVFIANIIKCRPPGNRNPLPEEEANCAPYLARQLEVLRPKVIVALGGVAAKFLLQTSDGITRLRGRFYPYKGAQLIPTFHPAYVLRSYTKDTRQKVYDDLLMAKEALA